MIVSAQMKHFIPPTPTDLLLCRRSKLGHRLYHQSNFPFLLCSKIFLSLRTLIYSFVNESFIFTYICSFIHSPDHLTNLIVLLVYIIKKYCLYNFFSDCLRLCHTTTFLSSAPNAFVKLFLSITFENISQSCEYLPIR